MNKLPTYCVEFTYGDGLEPLVREFQAANVGQAYEKCRQQYPGAKLIKAWRQGKLLGVGGGGYHMSYPPVSATEIKAEPEQPKTEQITFPYWNGCLGKGRLTELTS
jgi:hypothetical protein